MTDSRVLISAGLDRTHLTGLDATIEEVSGDVVAMAAETVYDCIVLANGFEAIARLRAANITTPIVCIADHEPPDATDFVTSSELSALRRRVTQAVRLARAERSAAQTRAELDEMLVVVSHDLRGPLNAINVALEVLGDDTVVGDERARYIASVRRSVVRADRFLDDLLTVHQIDIGTFQVEPAKVAVKTLLEQAMRDHELIAKRAGMSLVLDVSPGVGSISADRQRISQALDNLIGNAVRYATGSPRIELSASPASPQHVAVRVRDHGPGIPPNELATLFEREARARRSRPGFGLSIVRGIAHAHQGDVTVANAADGGAVFTLTLPTIATISS